MDLNSLAPAFWNLIVLSKYVKEKFTTSSRGNCNSTEIDDLRSDLNRIYAGHEYDIDIAIEDTKKHSDFIGLDLLLDEIIGQPRQRQSLNQESDVWKGRSPRHLSGTPGVNEQYSLRGYEVEEFRNIETGQHCNEVRIHPYDRYGQIGSSDFNAKIPMTQQLEERIRGQLGQYQVLGQDFIISVESPDLIGDNFDEISLKPQWAFERFYDGSNDVRCDVECWCKVFQLRGSRIVDPTYLYFPPETVILHNEGGLLRASNDSHHLGFGKADGISRAVLYSINYINGPIANTTKTGLILFIPNQIEYQYWTNLAYVYQNSIREALQAMRREYWNLGIPLLNLLGIPIVGA